MQAVDSYGNANAAPTCTATDGTCPSFAQAAVRPLRSVSIPIIPTLSYGSVTVSLTITLSPPLDQGQDLTIVPTASGGLLTFIPPSLSFAGGGSSASSGIFDILSSAAGLPATVSFIVSSSPGAGVYGTTGQQDYSQTFSASSNTRYVVDSTTGGQLVLAATTTCPTNAYPGGISRISLLQPGGSSIQTVQQGCITCPK